MTKEDQNYINSINLWVKSQRVLVEQIQISASYNQQMIESHTKALNLNIETLAIEAKSVGDVVKVAKEWCGENGIDPALLDIA